MVESSSVENARLATPLALPALMSMLNTASPALPTKSFKTVNVLTLLLSAINLASNAVVPNPENVPSALMIWFFKTETVCHQIASAGITSLMKLTADATPIAIATTPEDAPLTNTAKNVMIWPLNSLPSTPPVNVLLVTSLVKPAVAPMTMIVLFAPTVSPWLTVNASLATPLALPAPVSLTTTVKLASRATSLTMEFVCFLLPLATPAVILAQAPLKKIVPVAKTDSTLPGTTAVSPLRNV